MSQRLRFALIAALGLATAAPPAGAQLPAAKSFAPPAVTDWAPIGCRAASPPNPLLPPRDGWRNLHGDAASSDEVSIALPAVLRTDWSAETATYNVTGPVFDSAGNLYFAPFIPYENVVLISLEPTAGAPGGRSPVAARRRAGPRR